MTIHELSRRLRECALVALGTLTLTLVAVTPSFSQTVDVSDLQARIAVVEGQKADAQRRHDSDYQAAMRRFEADRVALDREIKRIQADLQDHATSCDYHQALRSGKRNVDGTVHFNHVRAQTSRLSQLQFQLATVSRPLQSAFNPFEYDQQIRNLRYEISTRQSAAAMKPIEQLGTTMNQAFRDFNDQARSRRADDLAAKRQLRQQADEEAARAAELEAERKARSAVEFFSYRNTLSSVPDSNSVTPPPMRETYTPPSRGVAPEGIGVVNRPAAPAPDEAPPVSARLWNVATATKDVFDTLVDVVEGKVASRVEAMKAVGENAFDETKLVDRVMDSFGTGAGASARGNQVTADRAGQRATDAAKAFAGSAQARGEKLVPEAKLPGAANRLRNAVDELFDPQPKPAPKP